MSTAPHEQVEVDVTVQQPPVPQQQQQPQRTQQQEHMPVQPSQPYPTTPAPAPAPAPAPPAPMPAPAPAPAAQHDDAPRDTHGRFQGRESLTPEMQEWLNNQIGTARKEGRSAGQKALLQELGVGDEKALKDALARQKELEAAAEERRLADMSEQDRLRAQAEQYRLAREESDRRAADATQTAHQALIVAELKVLAQQMRFHNWRDAAQFIDQAGIKVDMANREVDGLEKAMKALVKERPYLVQPEPVAPPPPSAPAPVAPPQPAPVEPIPVVVVPPAPAPLAPPTPRPVADVAVSEAEKDQAYNALSNQVRSWF